jgi:hypothetical protein
MNTATINAGTIRKSFKKEQVIYWIFTSLIVLLDSVIPAFTFNTDLAKQGISHLGFPDYFRIELSVAKIIGGILLILPVIPARYKEWAYVGFGINFISAIIANFVTDGAGAAILPLVGLVLLTISYIYYHKIKNR